MKVVVISSPLTWSAAARSEEKELEESDGCRARVSGLECSSHRQPTSLPASARCLGRCCSAPFATL